MCYNLGTARKQLRPLLHLFQENENIKCINLILCSSYYCYVQIMTNSRNEVRNSIHWAPVEAKNNASNVR